MSDCNQVDYGLAPGYNNPENIQVIAGYTVSGDVMPFQQMMGWGQYNPGVAIVLGDLTLAYDGNPSTNWIFGYITYDQVRWLQTTYCNSGWSGLVTVALTTDTPNEIQFWNAVMRLTPIVGTRPLRPGYSDYVITFVLDEQLDFGYILDEDGGELLMEDGSTIMALDETE